VPWTSNRFAWWLQPQGANPGGITVAGAALVVVLYGPDGSGDLATVLSSPWKTLQLLQSVNRTLTTARAKWG
jgi:hypothetical protein